MTNQGCIEAWLHGRDARAGDLRSENRELFSYRMLIGRRQAYHVELVLPGPSQTTRRHISLARRVAEANGLEIKELTL